MTNCDAILQKAEGKCRKFSYSQRDTKNMSNCVEDNFAIDEDEWHQEGRETI
jgi:hypothetical protein